MTEQAQKWASLAVTILPWAVSVVAIVAVGHYRLDSLEHNLAEVRKTITTHAGSDGHPVATTRISQVERQYESIISELRAIRRAMSGAKGKR